MKKFSDTKNGTVQIGLRLPQELNKRLERHVKKIGISKPAFILCLVFNELENKEKYFNNSAGDDSDE